MLLDMPVNNLILLYVSTQTGRQKYLSHTWTVPMQVNSCSMYTKTGRMFVLYLSVGTSAQYFSAY